MFGLMKKSEEAMAARTPVAVVEPEPVVPAPVVMPDKPAARKADPMLSESGYSQYAAVAEKVGFMVPEMLIERLKLFLIKQDLPVYELANVVKYMDAIAKRDNPDGYGWHWKPLRSADTKLAIHFGTAGSDSRSAWEMRISGMKQEKVLASDYFASVTYWGSHAAETPGYDKVVPVHALERVAMIEKEFGPGKVAFAVSDYATQPHIRPDPFLMAMVPNQKIGEGVGRFVIDVWDEPGFGILDMVK